MQIRWYVDVEYEILSLKCIRDSVTPVTVCLSQEAWQKQPMEGEFEMPVLFHMWGNA